MTPRKQELIDAIEHISFEMNRYLYTAYPIHRLPGRYSEVVAESCLLHSRNVGEFFFEEPHPKHDDIRICHYYDELISKDELQIEINKSKLEWNDYKERVNKQLSHLTYTRVYGSPMGIQGKDKEKFRALIELFEKNLPEHFIKKWNVGKSYSIDRKP